MTFSVMILVQSLFVQKLLGRYIVGLHAVRESLGVMTAIPNITETGITGPKYVHINQT
jgi:hypothetical protein